MTFNGRPDKVRQDRLTLERLSQGKTRKEIAAEIGCSYSTLRRRLARYVKDLGCRSVEQAVARHVTEKIKAAMPLALQSVVERVMRLK